MKKIFNNIKLEKDDNGNFIMNKKGITLIALVITIVVLIILATLVIGISLGQNGILNRAKQAKEDYLVKANEEQVELAKAGNIESTRDNTSIGPAGSVIAFMGDNEPEGYLKCEGQAVSRTTYSDLFKAIGTKYGAGDGSTTFNVPDLRGEFLRGAGTNTTTGFSGGNVGAHQNPTKHRYFYADRGYMEIYGNGATVQDADKTLTNTTQWGKYSQTSTTGDSRPTWYTSRPTNTSVLYCIKY